MTATAYDPREKLTADIERAGFYPDLVRDIVDEALAGLEPESHLCRLKRISAIIICIAISRF